MDSWFDGLLLRDEVGRGLMQLERATTLATAPAGLSMHQQQVEPRKLRTWCRACLIFPEPEAEPTWRTTTNKEVANKLRRVPKAKKTNGVCGRCRTYVVRFRFRVLFVMQLLSRERAMPLSCQSSSNFGEFFRSFSASAFEPGARTASQWRVVAHRIRWSLQNFDRPQKKRAQT